MVRAPVYNLLRVFFHWMVQRNFEILLDLFSFKCPNGTIWCPWLFLFICLRYQICLYLSCFNTYLLILKLLLKHEESLWPHTALIGNVYHAFPYTLFHFVFSFRLFINETNHCYHPSYFWLLSIRLCLRLLCLTLLKRNSCYILI